MKKIKIGIVEDEVIIAYYIVDELTKLGYDVVEPAHSYIDAISMLHQYSLDLILIDIRLGSSKDGIDLALYIRENYSTPLIFLTANSDKATIDKAKKAKPNAFIVKPFTPRDLFTAIEIAKDNFDEQLNVPVHIPTSIIVKDGFDFVKIRLDDILYVQSFDNYVIVYLNTTKRIVTRSTLSEMSERLTMNNFFRTSRFHIVNLMHLEKIKTNHILIAGVDLPISKNVKKMLLEKLNSI
jgi:two-component system response regulator LytT